MKQLLLSLNFNGVTVNDEFVFLSSLFLLAIIVIGAIFHLKRNDPFLKSEKSMVYEKETYKKNRIDYTFPPNWNPATLAAQRANNPKGKHPQSNENDEKEHPVLKLPIADGDGDSESV